MNQTKVMLIRKAVMSFGEGHPLAPGILAELSLAFEEERTPRFSRREREVVNTWISKFLRTAVTLNWKDRELLEGGAGGDWATNIDVT